MGHLSLPVICNSMSVHFSVFEVIFDTLSKLRGKFKEGELKWTLCHKNRCAESGTSSLPGSVLTSASAPLPREPAVSSSPHGSLTAEKLSIV